jgi:hypothetical protein
MFGLRSVEAPYYYAHLAHPLTEAAKLTLSTSRRPRMYCNRTATGLIRTSTQWTNLRARSTETRINKLKTGRTSTG